MYVVKVMHGYIDKTGCRTREKNLDNLLIFKDKKESEAFAKRIGGRVKPIQEVRPDWSSILTRRLRQKWSTSRNKKKFTKVTSQIFVNFDLFFEKSTSATLYIRGCENGFLHFLHNFDFIPKNWFLTFIWKKEDDMFFVISPFFKSITHYTPILS